MTEKILIIDDDVETLRLVGLMLQRQGYQIVAASSGAQGIVQAEEEQPALIILDVMMPDMDGYEVARSLKGNPLTAGIPILMFTAKSQVDDKLNGYSAGVQDYLTKPIHPAELAARVKALLVQRAPASASSGGYMIGVLGARGGVGASSLTLNLAICLQNQSGKDIIAAELRPGQGAWAGELGYSQTEGLNNLLKLEPARLTAAEIEKELIRSKYGPRLLVSSYRPQEIQLTNAIPQVEKILKLLPELAGLVLLDIGVNLLPNFEKVMESCREVLVITEPHPATVQRTRLLIDEILKLGFGKSRLVSVVAINRAAVDMQLTIPKLEEQLGMPVAQVISPAPEIAYYAAANLIPLLQAQPEGIIIAQQYNQLATAIAGRAL